MLINFTNHPCSVWSKEQLTEAKRWGNIIDLPFPNVSADTVENGIARLADEKSEEIRKYDPDAVLVQGEMSLAFAVVDRLLKNGIIVLCATSERTCETYVADDGSTVCKSIFRFVRFRQYGF